MERRKLNKKPQVPYGAYDGERHRHNKIFRRIESPAMNVHYYNNLAYAMQFGQPLLLDLNFVDHMNARSLKKTTEQINFAHGVNKLLRDPFHLHLCNFPAEGKFYHLLNRTTDILRPDLPITVTDRDVTELENIPKDKLVYLTADSPYELKFNHHDVYIMGGLVDNDTIEPVTFAKAKRLKLRTAKLPLDRHIVFQGGKILTLNQVLLILADLKKGLPMKTAVRHVPTRKVQRYLEKEDDDFIFVENRYAQL